MSSPRHACSAAASTLSPVLVVGGRGFVGSAVVRELLARGADVHVLGPESPLPLPAGADETRASIEDATAVRDVLARVRPRSVVSFAAYSSGTAGLTRSGELDPERMLSVNVLGFRRLLEACAAVGIPRVVWTSSTVVLGRAERPDERVDETAPRRPLVHYGLSKMLAEDVADYVRRREGMETVGLRIPLMLGPGLWYEGAASTLKRMVAAARAGASPAFAVPDVAFDAMHVADAGELVATLLGVPGSLAPLYHVAGFTTTYDEIAHLLAELVPGYAPRLAAETPPLVYPLVSQARLEQDTGWRHRRGLRATLLDMLAERGAGA